jgi:hypothetical protein
MDDRGLSTTLHQGEDRTLLRSTTTTVLGDFLRGVAAALDLYFALPMIGFVGFHDLTFAT